MPFYPSPNRDDGYDITDFFTVDPGATGRSATSSELVRTCRDRGIRVIADFVMNHTSDQHPWFQAARSSPDSPYRDFYVWRDEQPAGEAGRRRLPGPGDVQLGLRPQGAASTTSTASTPTSPTSTSTTPRSATSSRR